MRLASMTAIAFATSVLSISPSLAEPNGAGGPKAESDVAKAAASKITARAAVMIRSFTADPTLELRRNKGIDTARRHAVGIYCLKPVSGIKAKESVASVTVNWISSYGNDLLATIAAPSNACEPNEFEVRTFKIAGGGGFVASDDVSFTLVVP